MRLLKRSNHTSNSCNHMNINIELSNRLKQLPPYLFVQIDHAKKEAVAQGRDIIDLGVGDPDTPTPDFIIKALSEAAKDPSNHHYALDAGIPEFREAIAHWYFKRFNVSLNPDEEIYPLLGTKEGIAHLPLGLVNPQDKVLIPEPCYPPYRAGSIFAGGEVLVMPLKEENNFLPDITKIPSSKLMFINYPNNPTTQTADREFFTKLVNIALEKEIFIASDLAYSEIYFENKKPMSILEIDGAKDIAIEFHSLSKTFNMTGWRIGWACGNSKILKALSFVKSNIDSGIFQAIQIAGIKALKNGDSFSEKMRLLYQERRDIFVDGLNTLGWEVKKPSATFYVWAKLPKGYDSSIEFAKFLLDRADIVTTPGIGFGTAGEGYIRFALTVDKFCLEEAVQRIKSILG